VPIIRSVRIMSDNQAGDADLENTERRFGTGTTGDNRGMAVAKPNEEDDRPVRCLTIELDAHDTTSYVAPDTIYMSRRLSHEVESA